MHIDVDIKIIVKIYDVCFYYNIHMKVQAFVLLFTIIGFTIQEEGAG